MPGAIPGLPGLAAFAGIKFGGYFLAGIVLRKVQPSITASALKIAAARTGLGVLVGPPVTVAEIVILNHFSPAHHDSALLGLYPWLFALRVTIWALVIFIFTRQFRLPGSKFWSYACAGAVWSCLLDFPGVELALISPGQTPIC